MSTSQFSVQDLSYFYTSAYFSNALCALLFYDWLLCSAQEVKLIWRWHSGVTVFSAVYACSRYGLLIGMFLQVATLYPMSDRSCAANTWLQVGGQILSTTAFSAFSGLRAYALSNRSIWLVPVIIILAIAPSVITIIQCIYQVTINLPSPFNCNGFAIELIVVGITWWYTYQWYRIRSGLQLGKSISSVLIYNGKSFLAAMYIVDIILNTGPVSDEALRAANILDFSCDLNPVYSITSILVCRFMLSLREFESTAAPMPSFSLSELQDGENTGSVTLEFAAQPSDTLPALIAPFAHPVHVNSFDLFGLDQTASLAFEDRSEEEDTRTGEPVGEVISENAAPV
ncbi:hypothetical protein V8D89_001186 [Ganoderma adspersum]